MKNKFNSIYWNLLVDVIIALILLIVFYITANQKMHYDGHYQWQDYSVFTLVGFLGLHALLQLGLFLYNVVKKNYIQSIYFVCVGAFLIFIAKWIVLTFVTLRLGGTPAKPLRLQDKKPIEKKKDPVQDIRRKGELV